ncbi:GntR family transcriptional regulator [Gloeocapsopsis sp. IPPAS B-1203]|uniref:GntR family transcriptional regulator n=1 Tax=Gloeocapsopsis sp. IPPAS B-1203 TaxID=2049454 RepID=UPI000C19C14B|nr:GntR family transcriptional regulator [Gloeocapsopsis sp. IPPAS B-1203]PIG93130.1 transcriptional regulator [Gloeocapsopsis sp. IPPAS B-1203]
MTSPVAVNSNLPLHLAISEQLREQIYSSEYSPGEQLPSEHQLMLQFNVSRITVRRAIANLVNQGLVISHRGKGVFVKDRKKVTRSLSNPLIFFDEDMTRQGSTASICSLSFEIVAPSLKVCKQLQLDERTPQVYCQKKVILTDQIPVAVDITYIPFNLGKTFATELQSSLIYPTLDSNGVSIERVATIIECTHAPHEVSDYLDIPLGAPLLVNRYIAYTIGEKPVICGETLSRADRLCYAVTLTKHDTKFQPQESTENR